MLELTSYNLEFKLRNSHIDENDNSKIHKDAKTIYELSHLKLYKNAYVINKVEILSKLVNAMAPTVSKDTYTLEFG